MKAFTIFFITALITAVLLPTGSAAALPGETTIVVNTLTDEYDAIPDTTCSLREAISAAVSDAPVGGCAGGVPGDSTNISLSMGTYLLALPGVDDANAAGDLDIYESAGSAEPITITGTHMALTLIDGGGIDRVLDINPYATVILHYVGVTNGQSQGDTHFGYGGGIYNEGNLTLQDAGVTSSVAGRDTTNAPGGGIFNAGTLSVYDSLFRYNQTLTGVGSNPAGSGGGIYNNNILHMTGTLVSANYTGNGGSTPDSSANGGDGAGIYNNGTMDIYGSMFSYNSTGDSSTSVSHGGHGGAIFNAGTAEIYTSTFFSNVTGDGSKYAGGNGGGVSNTGVMIMANSTVAGNLTGRGATGPTNYGQGGYGGGLYSSGSASIYLSTFVDNRTGTGTPYGNGGGVYLTGTTKLLEQSIVANNSAAGTSPDCYAYLDNPRYNLIENATNCVFQGSAIGNITGQDPQLSEFRDLGTYMAGYVPLRSSPAIDKVLSSCYSNSDQRGSLRPIDGDQNGSAYCDIGAVEIGMPFFIPMIFKP
jgi:CSLREA domain-containing protein